MKVARLIALPVAVLLCGCNDSPPPGQEPASKTDSSVATAPTDYLKSAAQSQQKAVKTIDVAALNKAIEAFYIQEGRFPKKLEELEEKGFMRALPLPPAGTKIIYDTNSGVVSIEKDLGN